MSAMMSGDILLDCKNLICPMPILKISQAIKVVNVGQTILMEATDPGSLHDMPAWAKRTGHVLLAAKTEGDIHRFLVRRTK